MDSLSPFRLLAVGLAGITYAVVRESITFALISPLFLDAVLWLCLVAALGLALHEEPLHAGMILSNEPGYYKAGHFGIRIENLVIVVEDSRPSDEQPMLAFETITLAPIDKRLIDPGLLTPAEVAALFRVDPKTVTRWAKAGKLTSIRTLGGHRRYRAAEVRALLGDIPGQRTGEADSSGPAQTA